MSKKASKPAAEGAAPAVTLAAHPRASAAVRQVRGRFGIAGFALVLLLCLRAGVPGQDAVLRALAGGIVAFFASWACAVAIYRQLVLAELRTAEARWHQRRAARVAERAEA